MMNTKMTEEKKARRIFLLLRNNLNSSPLAYVLNVLNVNFYKQVPAWLNASFV